MALLPPQNTPKAAKKTPPPEHCCHGCPTVYSPRWTACGVHRCSSSAGGLTSPPADEEHPPLRLFQGTRGPCGRVSVKKNVRRSTCPLKFKSEQETWGEGGGAISLLSENDRIEAITRSRLTPQSAPFADLSTLGPVIVCGVRSYRFVYGLV